MKRKLIMMLVGMLMFLVGTISSIADTIVLVNGVEQKAKVLKESWDKVTISINGMPNELPAERIKTIIYDNQPAVYKQAKVAFNRGAYKNAIKFFKEAMNLSIKYKWLKQYCLYYIGLCYLRQKNTSMAREYFERLLTTIPRTRFLADAIIGIGESFIIEGKLDRASAEFEKLANHEISQTFPKYEYLAKYWKYRLLEAQRKYDEAYERYTRLYELTSKRYPEIAVMAQLRAGRVLIYNKNYKKAEKFFKDIINSGKRALLPAAYNGLGYCYFQKKDYESARFAYLRVVLLYFDNREELPEALYYAARCFELLKAKESQAIKRAKELYYQLIKEFPSSQWAQKAKSRISKM